ncbi:hypothetical protein C8R47DRAFT_1191824 [Mycena vitilis]|nr:hypothetical protein C8R47DRAFT_1191824 [Mycena vitilis]
MLPSFGAGAFLTPADALTQGRPRASSWGSTEASSVRSPSRGHTRGSSTSSTAPVSERAVTATLSSSSSGEPRVYESPYPLENPRIPRPRSWDQSSDKPPVDYPGGLGPPQQKPFPGHWRERVWAPKTDAGTR